MLTLASVTLFQNHRLPQTSWNHTTHVSAFISTTLVTESHSLPKIVSSQVQQMLTTHCVNLGRYITRNLVSNTGHLVLSEKRSRGSYGELGTCHETWVTRNTHRIFVWKSLSKLCNLDGWGNLRNTVRVGRKRHARNQMSVTLIFLRFGEVTFLDFINSDWGIMYNAMSFPCLIRLDMGWEIQGVWGGRWRAALFRRF
jgi:hypothetical protein